MQIRDSIKRSLAERLRARQRERWPQLEDLRVRFRGPFAYVDAVIEGGEVLPLCRLRYTGSADRWGFAPYLGSKGGYETSVLPDGSFTGPPEHALDERLDPVLDASEDAHVGARDKFARAAESTRRLSHSEPRGRPSRPRRT